MKKLGLVIFTIIFFFILLGIDINNSPSEIKAETSNCSDLQKINSSSAMLYSLNTSQILCSFQENKAVNIGSLSKLVVVYMILEELDNENIYLHDIRYISEYGYEISKSTKIADYYYDYGRYGYTVEELLKATIVYSSPTAALTLAEYIAELNDEVPTEKSFIKIATRKLSDMGIKNSVIYNSSGLYNDTLLNILETSDKYNKDMHSHLEIGKYNMFSAKDFATLIYYMNKLSSFDYIINKDDGYYTLDEFDLNENNDYPSSSGNNRNNRNKNNIENEVGLAFSNNYTFDKSMETSSLISIVNINSINYAILALDGVDADEKTSKQFVKDDAYLLVNTIMDFQPVSISNIGIWKYKVYNGNIDYADIEPTIEHYMFIHKNSNLKEIGITFKLNEEYNYNSYLKAPVKSSTRVGTAKVNLDDFNFLDESYDLEIDFRVKNDVKRANIFKQIPMLVMRLFDSLANWIRTLF